MDPGANPTLDAAVVDRLTRYGECSAVEQDAVLVSQGSLADRFIVVVDGRIVVEQATRTGIEFVAEHGPGQFFGDVHNLSGRPTLVSGRVAEAGRIITIYRPDLQKLMQGDSQLGELFMRAFILRRIELLATASCDAVLLGSTNSVGTLRIREFLTRNGYPFTFVDLDRDEDVQSLLDQFQVSVSDVPVLICRGKEVLRNPSNAEIAACLGLNDSVSESDIRDVSIVGAGPAGLSAAVYAASEGLTTIVLETTAPGGQAGSSSKIENYLGFPNGIAGLELAGRAFDQAQKFGAEVLIAHSAVELSCTGRPYRLTTDGGTTISARNVVIATGAQYRRLPLPNLDQFDGVGVYYGASTIEAQLCTNDEVAIVGGGNSAGQAAVFLSGAARHVHILIRSGRLASTMSRYLVRRIEESPNITLHPHVEVVALRGGAHLEGLTWRHNVTGATEDRPLRHLYLMTGASPNTDWLRGCVAVDDKGFVRTGPDLTAEDLAATAWPLARRPFLLETSRPGVFAVGDVRSGSVKRVASGVGEGSLAISFAHQVLAE